VLPAPKIKKNETSESVLKLLLDDKKLQRTELDFLVEHTFYKGELFYSKA